MDRLARYRILFPDDVCDVNQNPDARPLHSIGAKLNTLIKNIGIMFLPKTYVHSGDVKELPCRWLAVPELFLAMGFPVTDSTIEACCGAKCPLSRGVDAIAAQSRRSACNQVGNTMHINSIGAVHMAILLLIPALGSKCPTSAADESADGRSAVASSSSEGFASAFHEVLRHKRARGSYENVAFPNRGMFGLPLLPKTCKIRDSRFQNILILDHLCVVVIVIGDWWLTIRSGTDFN